jgi:hypothetical protein
MGKSLIDYIITTPDLAMPRNATPPTAVVGRKLVSGTDHLPVLATIQRAVVRRNNQVTKVRLNATHEDFRTKDGEVSPSLAAYLTALEAVGPAYTNLISALQTQHAASQVSAVNAVQQAHEKLIGVIKQAVQSSFGYKHVVVGKTVPWWSQQLTDAIQDRTRAFEAFKASGLANDWHTYQNKRKATHKLVLAAKQAWQQRRSRAVTTAYQNRLNDDSVLGERDMWQYLHAMGEHIDNRCWREP